MAIVDRINEMTADPTGGTIEDALNNLKKVSGGGNNEIVIRFVADGTTQRIYWWCDKTLPELVDMITSDGKTMDFDKASRISAKLIEDYVAEGDSGLMHVANVYPMNVYILGDTPMSSYNFDFDEFQSIRNSLETDSYVCGNSKDDTFRSLLKLQNIADEFDCFYIGYKDPNSPDFDHKCYIINPNRNTDSDN